jgi:hypothetical protein
VLKVGKYYQLKNDNDIVIIYDITDTTVYFSYYDIAKMQSFHYLSGRRLTKELFNKIYVPCIAMNILHGEK